MEQFTFDLVVIGAGPGGYVAAIRAAQLGLKTAIVERSHLGGVCLNWGCIPTKALLKSGEVFETLSRAGEHGMTGGPAAYDFEAVVDRSRGVADKLSKGIAFLMKKNGIEVIEGSARLEPGHPAPAVHIDLKGGGVRHLDPRAVVLATGARARLLPAIGMTPDAERVWTYREAMVPSAAPKSVIVIGSGAIGIEFASFYRALGAEVTVVEALSRILPQEDEEVSAVARKAFEKRGIGFRLGAVVERLVKDGLGGVGVDLSADGQSHLLQAEVAIVAIGIEPNLEDLGLEALGLKLHRGHVVTDVAGVTNVPGLYAIGDIAGPPWLAHKASHEGMRCAEHIAGLKAPAIHSPIPSCTYSTPQIASVGLTEEEALRRGLPIRVGRYPFRNHGKALASGDTEGLVKVIFDAETDHLVGAHMVGAEVTELIHGFVVAMTCEATEAELIASVFPHPTLSEAMHEATLAAYDRAIHL